MGAAADRTHESLSPARPARVALVSESTVTTAGWSQRGMLLVRVQSGLSTSLFADPPDVIVLDRASSDARREAECWQVHDLLQTPLVILADGLSPDAVIALLERGADDVVEGPVDTPLLAARVAAILRRRGDSVRQLPPLLTLPGVEIDMERRVVRRGSTDRSLSRTEFSLLVALLQAGGRSCSHRALLRQVWRSEDLAAMPYLRLYIRYLRDKIEEDPRHPRLIVNVWGTGYRLALAWDSGTHAAAIEGVRSPEPSPVASIQSSEDEAWLPSSSSSAPSRTSKLTSLVSGRRASR